MNIKNMPKIELHCHLDGSVRPETVIELAKQKNIELPNSLDDVKKLLVVKDDCESLNEYLEKFHLPNKVLQTKEALSRVTYELMEDCAHENIKYIEIRFGPLLYLEEGLSIDEVISSVLGGLKKAENDYDIKGNLILSFLRHMPVETIQEVLEVGKKYLGKGVVAVDLAAGEEDGFCTKFIEPMKIAKSYGYRITIHAGEQGSGENVRDAIKLLGAERIGHGIYTKACDEAYKLVKEHKVVLEMCPTSNVQTKAVKSSCEHPIKDYYNEGILVTINTDNRTVSNTNLEKEWQLVNDKFNKEDLENTEAFNKQVYLNSVNASFATEQAKEKLRSYVV